MKNILVGGLLALACAGCSKSAETIADLTPAQKTETVAPVMQPVVYTIKKGSHYCDKNKLTAVDTAALHFAVRFDSSAVYTSLTPENQYDINKLYGFSDNGAQHHQFSARFGWRWSDGALRLFAYVYNYGLRQEKELGPVAIGAWVNCSIAVAGNQYLFSLEEKTQAMPRASTTPKALGYLLYPYFGGDESAPHDVRIEIKNR